MISYPCTINPFNKCPCFIACSNCCSKKPININMIHFDLSELVEMKDIIVLYIRY